MKTRLLFFVAANFALVSVSAQEMTVTADQTTFGLRAGVNFQNINGKDQGGNELNFSITTGYHAGVNAEIPIGSGFHLQPGVLYSLKGAGIPMNGGENQKVKLHYLEVPVNFVYKPILGTGNLVLGFGPYAAFGIGGNVNGREIDFTEKFTSSSAPQYKRFDAGGNLFAGYEFANNFSFQLNTQLGMVNIRPEDEQNTGDKSKWKNTGFGLSLGYRF